MNQTLTRPSQPGTAGPDQQDRGRLPRLLTALRETVTANAHTSVLVALMVVVGVGFTLANPSIYSSALNIQSIAYAVPEIGLLALAVCLAMVSGGIDLSIVATANLAALTTAGIGVAGLASGMAQGPLVLLSVLAGLGVAALCGLVNGLLVAKARIAPILATLATMQLFGGIAILVTRGKPVYGLPDAFLALGTSTVGIVPVSFLLLVGVAVVLWYVLTRTGFGLRLTLVGASPEAADYSGIKRHQVLVHGYMLSGLVAGAAGMMMAARSASASASYGESYVLLAITIAVMGGTNPNGGRGPIMGVTLGSVILQMISSGFNMQGISPFVYQIAQGLILVVVLVVEQRSGRLAPWLRSIAERPRRLLSPTQQHTDGKGHHA